jgi:hypothetical protein
VPGHTMWRARTVRQNGHTVAVRARHRLLPWRSITVEKRDLRVGAEAIARELTTPRQLGGNDSDGRGARVDDQHGPSGMRGDITRDAPEHRVDPAGAAVRPEHDQAGTVFVSELDDRLPGG